MYNYARILFKLIIKSRHGGMIGYYYYERGGGGEPHEGVSTYGIVCILINQTN